MDKRNNTQLALFELDTVEPLKTADNTDKIGILIKELNKELYKHAPLSIKAIQFEKEMTHLIKTEFAEVSKDVILWTLGNMMKRYMKKLEENTL